MIEIFSNSYFSLGFPGSTMAKNPPTVQEILETWVRSLCQDNPLESEMASCSSQLAWKTPWTEEPLRLLFMVCRVRINLVTKDTSQPGAQEMRELMPWFSNGPGRVLYIFIYIYIYYNGSTI